MNNRYCLAQAILFCAICFAAGCGSWPGSKEKISDFSITMNFGADGTLQVEERIVALVHHDRIKDGMHRALWNTQPGNTFRVEAIGGEIDGKKCLFKAWDKNGRFFMRAMSDAGQLPTGPHEFCYRYRVLDAVRGGGKQSVRWNLTGRRWPWAIDNCEVVLNFDDGVDPETISAEIGHTEGGDRLEKIKGSGSSISFRTSRPLQGGDSLSLSASWSRSP